MLSRDSGNRAEFSEWVPNGHCNDHAIGIRNVEVGVQLILEYLMHRRQRRAQPNGSTGQQNILNAGVNGAIVRRGQAHPVGFRHFERPVTLTAYQQNHRRFMKVVDLMVKRAELARRLVGTTLRFVGDQTHSTVMRVWMEKVRQNTIQMLPSRSSAKCRHPTRS